MKAVIVAIVGVLSCTAPTLGQFSVDRTPSEIRRQLGTPALLDLAVGEVGLLVGLSMCTSDDRRLYVYANAPLASSRYDYSINWEAKKEPGGTVAITGAPGSGATSTAEASVFQLMNDIRSCGGDIYPVEWLLPISTINGKTSLSALYP